MRKLLTILTVLLVTVSCLDASAQRKKSSNAKRSSSSMSSLAKTLSNGIWFENDMTIGYIFNADGTGTMLVSEAVPFTWHKVNETTAEIKTDANTWSFALDNTAATAFKDLFDVPVLLRYLSTKMKSAKCSWNDVYNFPCTPSYRQRIIEARNNGELFPKVGPAEISAHLPEFEWINNKEEKYRFKSDGTGYITKGKSTSRKAFAWKVLPDQTLRLKDRGTGKVSVYPISPLFNYEITPASLMEAYLFPGFVMKMNGEKITFVWNMTPNECAKFVEHASFYVPFRMQKYLGRNMSEIKEEIDGEWPNAFYSSFTTSADQSYIYFGTGMHSGISPYGLLRIDKNGTADIGYVQACDCPAQLKSLVDNALNKYVPDIFTYNESLGYFKSTTAIRDFEVVVWNMLSSSDPNICNIQMVYE